MLKAIFISLLISFYGSAQSYITISDKNFAAFLNENFAICMSGDQLDISCAQIQSVEHLNINSLNLQNIDGIEYFTNLKSLECLENSIVSIRQLPTNLLKLDCSMNQLTSLPALPNSLEELSCAMNQLTSLPTLPNTLKILYCNFNEITALPSLPITMEYLACGSNKITCLPTLPESIFIGDIALNPLSCVSSHATWMDEESLKMPLCKSSEEVNNPNRCICITTTLLSVEKEENNALELGSTIVSTNSKNNFEIEVQSDVSIFPNPTKGNITVKAKDQISSISITDIEGKTINHEILSQNSSNESTIIDVDLSSLNNGIYFVKTVVGTTITTYKVIKTN
jgi:hypothetical protein